MAKPLEEIIAARKEKLTKLREAGLNPYPPKYSRKAITVKEAAEKIGSEVAVQGRITGWREHGGTIFADLADASGKIQLWFQEDKLPEAFMLLKYFDVGDFLGAYGRVTKTQAGQTSVDVYNFELLAKALRPLPAEWYGLKDEETRYRQRYLDLLLHPELKELFQKKAVFWESMRHFLSSRGFLEVETPALESKAGGADATPFITHHNALDIDLYLRISMGELWQKRLMVAGLEKTFEIGRQFRNEGLSREHLQDYTQMEFYWAYADYEDSMRLVQEMYQTVAKDAFGKLTFEINGHKVDLAGSWPRIDYRETLLSATGVDLGKASDSDLKRKLKELEAEYEPRAERGRLIDALWKTVRKSITGPAFLTGHPVEVSPLAKRIPGKPGFVERYQVIIAGSELGNGYSELNDPLDQAERFQEQQKLREKGDTEAQMMDRDFVNALEYGMPPVTGFGVSERLFSFLAGLPIRETVLFPLMRPEKES